MEIILVDESFRAIGRAEVMLAVITASIYPFVKIAQLAKVLEIARGDVKTAMMRQQHGIIDNESHVRLGRAEGIVLLMRARLNPPHSLDVLTNLHHPPPTTKEMEWAVREVARSHPNDRPRQKERVRHARAQVRIGPEGTAWCSRCCEFHPLDEFGKNKARASGRQDWCLFAVRSYWQERRASDRKRVKALKDIAYDGGSAGWSTPA